MNNKIAEIKEAYEKATNKGKWLDNGNEFVAENNQRCGIGGFITYEDSALVWLLITEVPHLLDELEKANTKCPDCGGAEKVIMCDDPYYAEPCICTIDWMSKACDEASENRLLRTEHAAMKEALEWYADNTNYDPYRFMSENGRRARETLSTLQCPTE